MMSRPFAVAVLSLALLPGCQAPPRPRPLASFSITVETSPPPSTGIPALLRVSARVVGSGRLLSVDLPPLAGAWPLPGGRALLFVSADGELGLWETDGSRRELARDVLPQIALAPDRRRAAYCRYPAAVAGGSLWRVELERGAARRLSSGGSASLPTFSPDGSRLAFVDTSPEGLASLFVVGADGARPPRQLTNIGLRAAGGPPPGFVAPPVSAADLAWVGDRICVRSAGPTGCIEAGR